LVAVGIGREVADAYIDVHGDLSKFRNDLNDLSGAEAAAIKNADKFSKAWADRISQDVSGKWASIVDAMYSDKKIDWDRLLGEFDAKGFDDLQAKVDEFLEKMRKGGKLVGQQYEDAKKALDGQIESLREQEKLLQRQEQEARGFGMALDANTKFLERMSKENERWARTFEGMTKNNRLADMKRDFEGIASAMSSADWSKFVKGFDSLQDASRRIREINALMHEQGRITDEQAARVQASFDAYIQAENEKSKAMREALEETKRLKEAQDKYNKSLDGMVRSGNMARMERDFRMLSDAIATGDWSNLARGNRDFEEMRFRIMRTADEMRRMGRMSDAELRMISRRIDEAGQNMRAFNIQFERANDNASRLRFNLSGLSGAFSRLNRITTGFRQHIMSLGGLNVFGDMIRQGLDFVHNMDRVALSLSKNTMLFSTMAAVGVSAVGSLVTIAADLGDVLGGLAVLAPAYFTGLAISIGVFAAAMQDAETVLKDLKPEMERLQDAISADFWREAAQPIRDVVKYLMPILVNKQGTSTASSLGRLVGKIAKAFNEIPAEDIATMFDRMNRAIDILGDAVAPLIRAMNNLGKAGSKTFERFAKWIVELSNQFDAFIQKAADNGDLDRWIENAIEGMKNIGRAIDGAIGIFNALNTAAERAGFGGLRTFADGLQNLAAAMQTTAAQQTLTNYFEAARIFAVKLWEAIKKLGPAFESFAPTAVVAMGQVGDAVAKVIGYVGQIFSNPTFQEGVANFTVSLNNAIGKLEPAIKPFADSLGSALTLLGKIAEAVATVAATFVIEWGPVLDSMSAKFGALIEPLKTTITNAITELKPVIEGVDKNIVGPLVQHITGEGGLLAAFNDLIKKVGGEDGVGAALTKNLGSLIEPLVGPEGALTGLVKLAGELVGPIKDLVGFLTPSFAAALRLIGEGFTEMANGIKVLKGELPIGELRIFKQFSEENIRRQIEEDAAPPGTWGDIMAEFLMGNVQKAIGDAAGKFWEETLKPLWDGFIGNTVDFFTGKNPKAEEINRNVNSFLDENVWKPIGDFFKNLDWGQVVEDLWSGFLFALTGKDLKKWEEITAGFTGWVEDVKRFFGIASPSTLMKGYGQDVMQGFHDGIDTVGKTLGTLWDGFKTTITTKAEEIKTGVTTWAGEVKTNWDNFWGGAGTNLKNTWEGFTNTVGTKAGEIKSGITTWAGDVGNGWNGFWGDVGTNLNNAWEGFTGTVSEKAGEIKTNVSSFGTDVKNNWDGFWGDVGGSLSENWRQFTGTVEDKSGDIKGDVASMGTDMKGNTQDAMQTMWRYLSGSFMDFVNMVSARSGDIVGWVGTLPGRIGNALSGLGGMLRGAGQSIMQGFLNGLTSMWGSITSFVGNIADWIRDNKGPLDYDRTLLEPAGQAIMVGLQRGLESRMDPLLNTLQAITDVVTSTVTADLSKSKMYVAGADAALGLADGLKANRSAVHSALGTLGAFSTPSPTVTVGGSFGAAVSGVATTVGGKSLTIAEGAISITTPTKDPELVAAKVIDSFANFSNF
jgi:phage-related protein